MLYQTVVVMCDRKRQERDSRKSVQKWGPGSDSNPGRCVEGWERQHILTGVVAVCTAADQPLRAELEVLLPALGAGQLRHGIRGGATAHQEALLGNLRLSLSEGTAMSWISLS